MFKRNKKILLYSLFSLLILFSVNKFLPQASRSNVIEASLANVLGNVADSLKNDSFDLAIEKVTLKKISEPSDEFNYFKYKANVVLTNKGGYLKNARVIMNAGDSQRFAVLTNSDGGFSLEKNQSYIYEGYDVIFDGNYNAGKIVFSLEVKDKEEINKSNNDFEVDVFELPEKVKSISLSTVKEDGTLMLNFEPQSILMTSDNYEIYTSDSLKVSDDELRYSEINNGEIYSYYKIKNTQKLLSDESWVSKSVDKSEANYIKFSDNPFEDENVHYVYVKLTDPNTNNYAFSNILKFGPQKKLSRADFAKLFVEYTKINTFVDGLSIFEDVPENAWFSPYVKTIYNLGLVNSDGSKFFPEELITRKDALKIILDYFDINLSGITTESSYFEDISETDLIYPYTQALFATSGANAFPSEFNPDLPATKNYLKYLINEYSKNN